MRLIPITRDVQFGVFENQLTNTDTYANANTDTNTNTDTKPCTVVAHGSLHPIVMKG